MQGCASARIDQGLAVCHPNQKDLLDRLPGDCPRVRGEGRCGERPEGLCESGEDRPADLLHPSHPVEGEEEGDPVEDVRGGEVVGP